MGEGSLSGWSEGILLIIAFLMIFSIIVTNYNGMYDKDNQVGFGTTTTPDNFIDYSDSADDKVRGGEADFDSNSGMTLKESWGITKGVYKIVMSFITGGFIEDAFYYTNLGESGQSFALILRILWTLSLIFAILYILFKVIA